MQQHNSFTQEQISRILKFDNWLENFIPHWDCPLWLLPILDKILPDKCPFYTVIFYNGKLIVYIPILCSINPFYYSLLGYRLKMLNEASDNTKS